MNYKTLLMASAAVLFSSQAMAQDLTGEFSVPGKGQIMSDTSIEMGRTKTSAKESGYGTWASLIKDTLVAAETLEYGITDNLSINGTLMNAFDRDTNSDVLTHYELGDYSYNNDHNFAYGLGAKYNMRFDDVLFQIAPTYTTWQPTTWFGHKSYVTNKWQKNLGLDLKAGLDLGNGLTPYIVYHIDSDIDTGHRELGQSVKVGVHKYAGKWALDGAISYEWSKNHSDKYPWGEKYNDKNTTETWFNGEADYYLKDNIALGIYGNYLIDSHDREYVWGWGDKEHTNFAYEVGLRVKVLF
jgi:hypothetical protein